MARKNNFNLPFLETRRILFFLALLILPYFTFISSPQQIDAQTTPVTTGAASTNSEFTLGGQNLSSTSITPQQDCNTAISNAQNTTGSTSTTTLYDELNQQGVKNVFNWVLSLVNFFTFFLLLAIAFANMLQLQIDNYAVKKALPALIIGVILANFSWLISRFVIDFSTVLYHTLVDGYGGGTGLFQSIATELGVSPQNMCSTTAGGYIVSGLIGSIVGTVLIVVAAILIFTLYLLLAARIWIVTLLVVLGPLACLSLGFPLTENLFRKWLTTLLNWTFMAPAAFLVLIVAARMTVGNGPNLTRYVLVAGLLFYAIEIPFKMGGSWMRQWGNYVSQFKKQAGSLTTKAADRATKGSREFVSNRVKTRLWNTRAGKTVSALQERSRLGRETREAQLKRSHDEGVRRYRESEKGKTRAQNAADEAIQNSLIASELKERDSEAQGSARKVKIDLNINVKEDQRQVDEKEEALQKLRDEHARTKTELDDATTKADEEKTRLLERDQKRNEAKASELELDLKGLRRKLDYSRQNAAKNSYEAKEAEISMIGSEESTKIKNKALFDQTDEGRRLLDQAAYFAAQKVAAQNTSQKAAQESERDFYKMANTTKENLKNDLGVSGVRLEDIVIKYFQTADLATLAQTQATKTKEAEQVKMSQERMTAHNYKARVDQAIQTLEEEEKKDNPDPAKIRILKSDADKAEAEMKTYITNTMSKAGNNLDNLPEHIKEMFEFKNGEVQIKSMSGNRFTSTAGAIGKVSSEKMNEYRTGLSATDTANYVLGKVPEERGGYNYADFIEPLLAGKRSEIKAGDEDWGEARKVDETRKYMEYFGALMQNLSGSRNNPGRQVALQAFADVKILNNDRMQKLAMNLLGNRVFLDDKKNEELIPIVEGAMHGEQLNIDQLRSQIVENKGISDSVISAIQQVFHGRITDFI